MKNQLFDRRCLFFIISICCFFVSYSQTSGECNADPLPYHYGANWKNASAIPRLPTPFIFTGYHTQHTDASLQGGNFVSTSTIVDHTGSGKLIKLHRFNPTNGAVDELKYRYPVINSNQVEATSMSSFFGATGNYITGGLSNYTLGFHDNPALIKRFDFNNPPTVPRNIDLLIRRHVSNTLGSTNGFDCTVITKMIEGGDGAIYAVGYGYNCSGTANNWTQAFMVRINPAVFNNPNFNCAGFGCIGDIELRVIPHNNLGLISWYNDLIEFDGRIYACGYIGIGSSPSAKIGWGLLSRWDDGQCWSFEQDFTAGWPPRVPPPGSGIWPTVSFNSMTIDPANNHLLLLYTDPFSYIGGILRMDNANALVPLALGGHTAFWLNNAPNPFAAPTAFPPDNNEIILSQIEYVSPTSILIGGYMQDVSLPPGSLPANLKNTKVVKDYFAFVVDHNPTIATNNGPFPFHSSYGYRNDQPLEDFETNQCLKKGWDIVVPNGRVFSRDAGNDIYFSSGKRRVSVSPFQQSNFVDRFPLVDLQTFVVIPGGRLNCERRPMCLESAAPAETTMPLMVISAPNFLQQELGIEVNTESTAIIDFGEDFKHFCDHPIDDNLTPQSPANQNVCEYFYDLEVEQNGVLYHTLSSVPGNRPANMRLCRAPNCIDLRVLFKHGIGLGENTYQWSRNSIPITGATNCSLQVCEADVPVGTQATYSVVCTHIESLGVCTTEYEVVIRGPLDAEIQFLGTTLCQGETLTLLGLPDNNPLTYTYLWSTGNTSQDIDVISPGTYTVTITFDNGCEDEESINIFWAEPTITQTLSELNPNPTNNVNFTNTIRVTNPTNVNKTGLKVTTTLPAGYSVNGALPAGWTQNSQVLTYNPPAAGACPGGLCLNAGDFIDLPLNLRAVNACQGEICTELTASPALACGTMPKVCNILNDGMILNPTITASPVSPKCSETSASYTGTSGGTIATPAKTHAWFRVQGGLPDPLGNTTTNFNSTVAGTYRYEVSQRGCVQFVDYTMTNHTPPTYNLDVKPTCANPQPARSSGSIEIQNIQPPLNSPNDLVWLTAAGGTPTANHSNPRSNLVLGDYTFRLTDINGCRTEETVNISNLNLTGILSNVIDGTCNPSLPGSFNFDYTPPTGTSYSHFWSSAILTLNGSSATGNILVSPANAGFHMMKIDNGFCSELYSQFVKSDFATSIIGKHTRSCGNIHILSATVSGSSVATHRYKWYTFKNGVYTQIAAADAGTSSSITYPSPAVDGEIADDLYLEVIQLVSNVENCRQLVYVAKQTNFVINLGSSIANASNIPITVNSTVSNQSYIISGLFNINVNNITFENMDFHISNNATVLGELRIKAGMTVTFKNCKFFNSCANELAKGIVVEHNASIKMENSTIDDMMRGIEFLQDANAELKGNRFGSNAIGIQLTHHHGRIAPLAPAATSIIGNTFQPTGSIKPNVKQIPYGSATILPSNAGSPVIASRGYAGIVSLATSVSLTSSPSTGYNISLGHQTFNASEVNTFSNLFYGIAALGGVVNVYHPRMSNMAQHIINLPQPFPFPPIVDYANSYSYPSGSTPMEGTGILFYNSTQSLLSQLTVQGNGNFENFNGAVFRAVDVRDANVTVNKSFMKNIYQGLFYKRSISSNAFDQVTFTENFIDNKLYGQGDMASAILIEDANITTNSTYSNYTIDYNEIKTEVVTNSSVWPMFLPGSGSPQPIVHFRGSNMPSSSPAISNRFFRYNIIRNKGVSDIGVKFLNIYGINESKGNEVVLSDGVSSLPSMGPAFRSCFEYEGCGAIEEQANKAMSSSTFMTSTAGIPAGSLPVGFNYRNTLNSNFTCNEAHRGLMSSVLFEGTCTNSYLNNSNLRANRYGIIIADNTSISVHHFRANKFYCGSHLVGATENHIWRGTNTGTGILFSVARLSSSFTSPCANVGSGQCYSHNNQGFIYAPSSIPSSIMQASMSTLDYPVETVQCPICIPPPKMASAAPLSNLELKSSECKVFPNPTSEDAKVELDYPAEVAMSVRILDMTGRVLLEDKLAAGAKEYKLRGSILSTGMYQVVVSNGKDIYCTKKLVVEK